MKTKKKWVNKSSMEFSTRPQSTKKSRPLFKLIDADSVQWAKKHSLIARELKCPYCKTPILPTKPIVVSHSGAKGLKCPDCPKCGRANNLSVVKSEDKAFNSAFRNIRKAIPKENSLAKKQIIH